VRGQATIQNGHIEAVGCHGQPKFRGIVRSSDFVALGSQVVGQFVDKKIVRRREESVCSQVALS